ncbi:MAG: metallophosphoesterase [Bacteroidales bacterium]|nr:MAG: metallophosphoesterase [Bacteroidales bacterium]
MVIVVILILLIDVYSFKGLVRITSRISRKMLKRIILYSFWMVSLLFLAGIFTAFLRENGAQTGRAQRNMFLFAGIMMTVYLPKILFIFFQFIEDLVRFFAFVTGKVFATVSPAVNRNAERITRSVFLSKAGLLLSVLPFGTFAYGMIHGKFNYITRFEKLFFPELPRTFNGLRIVHISDIHIGGLYGSWEKVEYAMNLINNQKPDLIFFTGDLVNDFAEELAGWIRILAKQEAKIGKYSILGNHDYGDYHYWESERAKQENLEKIKSAHREIGFRLLLNQSDTISLEGEKIAVVGVENWGKPPFAQYGDLREACKDTEDIPFIILLSHDPTHWDAEVLKHTEIQLTLSGHTHGMQFGIETKNIKWSPIKLKYPHWAGLYREGNQYLYVNRGFGYIGYPGRVGIYPEITVIDLFRKET